MGVIRGVRRRDQRSECICVAGETVTTIAVIALLVSVVGAKGPVLIECMLNSACDVDGVRRLVIRVDDTSGRSRAALQAAGAGQSVGAVGPGQSAGSGDRLAGADGLKCCGPS